MIPKHCILLLTSLNKLTKANMFCDSLPVSGLQAWCPPALASIPAKPICMSSRSTAKRLLLVLCTPALWDHVLEGISLLDHQLYSGSCKHSSFYAGQILKVSERRSLSLACFLLIRTLPLTRTIMTLPLITVEKLLCYNLTRLHLHPRIKHVTRSPGSDHVNP